jgi:hypothetical protein
VDLSFRFDRDVAVMTAIPTELAVLMVGVAARQAASRTAQLQALLARTTAADALLAPAHGAFSHAAESALNSNAANVALTGWQEQ